MGILFLLNGFVTFLFFIFVTFMFFKHSKNTLMSKFMAWFFAIGFLYLVFSSISFFWFFDLLSFSSDDFLLFYSLIITLQSVILFRIIFLFTKNKQLFFFLFFYVFFVFFVFLSLSYFLYLAVLISVLLQSLFFLNLFFRHDSYRGVGFLGIIYSGLAVFFLILLLFGRGNLYLYSFFLNLVFFVFVFVFLRNISRSPPLLKEKGPFKDRSYFFLFLSHFLFIVTLTSFIFVGTVAVHEFGHFAVSNFYDCSSRKIVYENGFFDTVVSCTNLGDKTYVVLAGILLPFILAGFMFFVGGKFSWEMALLICGFNFLAISKDLRFFGLSSTFLLVSSLVGSFLVLVGITLLVKTRAEEDIYPVN